MPVTKNLMNDAPMTLPNGETAIAPSPEEMTALLPGAQQALANPVDESIGNVVARAVGAYVGNAHPRSNNWAAVNAVGCEEGDFYVDGAGEVKKCMPFKFWLYAVSAYGTKVDATGTVVRATNNQQLIENQQQLKSAGYDEHFCTVVFVDLGNRIIPAKADFRTTKSNCAKVPIQWLRECVKPSWINESEAHKVASQFQHPFGRCYFTASTNKGTVKSGPNKGLTYYAAQCIARPTTVNDMERLATAISEKNFVMLVNQAYELYAARCQEINSAIATA